MKKTCILTLAAIAAVLFSCDKPGTEETPSGISIDKTTLNFSYEAGEQIINVNASSEWTITSYIDWCTVSPASGTGSAAVKVSVTTNPSKVDVRSTKIVLRNNGVALPITVNQETNPEGAVFSITPKSVDVPAVDAEFEVTVISDTYDYDITLVDSWIHLTSRKGDRTTTGEVLHFKADSHESGPRTGIISICTKDGSCIPVMVNQAGWQEYAHMNIGYRFTATWCGYCPYMDETFHKVAEKESNHFNFITFHASSGYPLYISDSDALCSLYNVQGFPTGVLNGWKELNNYTDTDYAASSLVSAIEDYQKKFFCGTGISVNTSVSDGKLNVEASVKSIPGEHRIAAFVLESGIVEAQTYYPTSGGSQKLNSFVHDNVARKVLTNSPAGEIFTAGNEASSFNWSTDLNTSWAASKLSVAVVVMRPYNEYSGAKANRSYPGYYIVNSVIVPAGGSKEMEYAQ